MTDAGAAGTTDSEIRKALQVTLPGEDFHYALNGLNQSLESHSDATENLEIKVENSIWAQKDVVKLKVGFLDKLARHYDAGVNMVDFIAYPDSSRVIINDWVADQTNQRILNLLPQNSITSDTRLVLTNAIYFLADWHTRFDAAKTDDQQFTRLDRSKITVPMMMLRDTTLKLLYSQKDNARMLELPYKGKRMVMDFILPDAGAFTSFEASLTSEKIDALIDGLDSTTLPPVRIPRFEFTSQSISLKKAFIAMGMVQPFTGSADFSNMSNLELMIGDILHKAFIKVDEKGTEAAAATAVLMVQVSFPPAPKPSFVADRPFIYLIRDIETKTILFMGRVLDPTVKK
jgi:serpin B